jgi:hypothetical protein
MLWLSTAWVRLWSSAIRTRITFPLWLGLRLAPDRSGRRSEITRVMQVVTDTAT